jgi:hypothetical protein
MEMRAPSASELCYDIWRGSIGTFISFLEPLEHFSVFKTGLNLQLDAKINFDALRFNLSSPSFTDFCRCAWQGDGTKRALIHVHCHVFQRASGREAWGVLLESLPLRFARKLSILHIQNSSCGHMGVGGFELVYEKR